MVGVCVRVCVCVCFGGGGEKLVLSVSFGEQKQGKNRFEFYGTRFGVTSRLSTVNRDFQKFGAAIFSHRHNAELFEVSKYIKLSPVTCCRCEMPVVFFGHIMKVIVVIVCVLL
jgi:hypothetical protein